MKDLIREGSKAAHSELSCNVYSVLSPGILS